MLSALDKKLLRDIWKLRGQILSIALVISSGIALLVMSLSTYEALRVTSDTYYDRYRFGHVFATVKRAPQQLVERISSLDGVQSVQSRVVMSAVLDVDGFQEPLMGRLVSVPEGRQPELNRLFLRSGRLVEPGRPDEVVINEAFARSHNLEPGDSLQAIINNTKRQLRIVGTAQSPEFIYVISPFAIMPDKKRFGILWMGSAALEAAYDFDGAFNDLTVSVSRGTDTRQVVVALDALLGRFGGTGAIDRTDHISSWFVQNELEQNKTSAQILPTIFLLVAAFLANSVLTRLIIVERNEIGLLKAFGYTNAEVGWHYVKFVLAIVALGIVLGWLLGATLGRLSTESYTRNLNLPLLIYRPSLFPFLIGALVSIAVGLLATARAVRQAARLEPIVAMSPPAPPVFGRDSSLMRHFSASLDEPTRIVIRQITRWPGRAAITAMGFAGAVAMMVLSLYFTDATEEIARTHFDEVQREDVSLGFNDPRPYAVLGEVERLPGVLSAEPMRIVSADLIAGYRKHRGSLQGLMGDSRMTRVYDVERGPLPIPKNGIVLASALAEKLRLGVGDELEVRILEGGRPSTRLMVEEVNASYIGMSAYLDIDTLNRLMGERPVTQYVNARIDKNKQLTLLTELKNLPAVSVVALKSVAMSNFNQTVAESLMIFVGFFSVFSFALGFGVTYNAQRIALSERGRELATLRVLGFSQNDALYILVGETMLLVCLAIPVGCILGWILTAVFVNSSGFQTELMRLPFTIRPTTYGTAIVVLVIAAAASSLAIKRWVDRLDLISVLKTRD